MSSIEKHEDVTYADIEALPEHVVGEIVAGELLVSPRPSGPHAQVTSVLGMTIGSPFHLGRGGPGGWIILDEPELHLGGDVLVPDLAGWRKERLPRVPQDPRFTVSPDWVCEVLSRSTARFDRTRKASAYAREHVHHLWFVDPIEKTLEVLRAQDGSWLIAQTFGDAEHDKHIRAEPFDAVEIDLSALWLPDAD
ncbi:MAG: Uma2 family endonuclease [Myxococcota bacterium]